MFESYAICLESDGTLGRRIEPDKSEDLPAPRYNNVFLSRMRKHSLCILIAAASATSLMAAPAAGVEVSCDSVYKQLEEVQVTERASKAMTSSTPTHSMTASVIKKTGVTSVADAAHRMPGVTLRDYGGAGGLKTISVRGFGASHTGVVYDGVPVSDVQSGQVDLSRYSTDNVRELSMVIGDSDDIFQSARLSASASTFAIQTQPSPSKKVLEAKFKTGSWNYYNAYFKAGMPLSSSLSINASGEFTHAGNDYPFRLVNGENITTEHRNNSHMNSGHAEINTLWRPGSETWLTAKAYYYDNSRRLPGPVILYNDRNNESLKERNAFGQAALQHNFSGKVAFKALAKFNFSSSKYHDEKGIYPGGVLNQNYWQREYYASAAVLYTPLEQLKFSYAADYFFNNLNSNLSSDKHPYRHSILQALSVRYQLWRATLTGRLLGSLYYNGAKQGSSASDVRRLSPSLSLSVQPMAGVPLYVRASYKNIFRVPTFNEAYFDHYGSQDVLPENTDQLNLGLTYRLSIGDCSATFTADAYRGSIKDMIVAVPFNMYLWRIVNLSKARILGLDLTATADVKMTRGHSFLFTGNYSLQRAEPRTDPSSAEWGKQVAYIPRHTGHAALAWENPWCNISVNASAVSARFTTNNNLPETRIAGYAEFGASAWRSFTLNQKGRQPHQLELKADLLNMFNRQYYIVARYPMPGRSWQVAVSFIF